MNNKKFLLLGILVIFLTIGCVSAADDEGAVLLTATSANEPVLLTTTSADDTVLLTSTEAANYDITEDTYADYFDENGTFTVTPEEGQAVNVNIGDVTNKNFIFNVPDVTIAPLDETSQITNGTITLLAGAEGAYVHDLTIVTEGFNVVGIENFASNVVIEFNNIQLSGEAEYSFAGIMVHDSDNIVIANNTITINATGQYAYAIDLYTNYVENATISNAVVSGNIVNGVGDYYLAGVSAMNGVVYSNITNNKFNLEATNLTYGVATAKNYANSEKSGNLIISDNEITLKSDMAYGIESAEQVDLLIEYNTIDIEANGAVGIGVNGLENSEISNNLVELVGGTITNSYWDSIPNDNVGILAVGSGEGITIANNNIAGINVDGISITGSNNIIKENVIVLGSDENIQVSSYGSSMVMGIESTGDDTEISANLVNVTGNATYNYGIDVYSSAYPGNVTDYKINDNYVFVDSDSNYGAGIYAGNVNNADITDNHVSVTSQGMGYGITENGEASNVAINNNEVVLNASNARGIEVTSIADATVDNNNVSVAGDSVYGLAAGDVTSTEATGNIILTIPGNLEDAYSGYDSIPAGQAAVYATGSENDIKGNTLEGLANTITSSDIVAEDVTIVQGSGDNFTAYLLDANGNPIIGHHAFINLTRVSSGASKVYELVSDFDGKLSIPINLAQGEYTASLSYDGLTLGNTTYLADASDAVKITVGDGRVATNLAVSPMTKNYGEDAPFTGTLTANGSPVAGQHVQVTLSRLTGQSKTYDVTTDYNGIATLPINLGRGTYLGSIAYAGTSEYLPTESAMVSISIL